MTQDTGRELDWNDEIQNDGEDFVLLDPGTYDFRIGGFERKRYGGGDKLPACNMAALKVEIITQDGQKATTITNNLFLHTKTEGLICQFFRSIGARKHGERLVMDWNSVIGATGICQVSVRQWKKLDGTEMKSNEIKKFLDPPETGTDTQEKDDIPF